MNGIDLLKGSAPAAPDTENGKEATVNKAVELLKGDNPTYNGNEPPETPEPKEDDPVLKELKELRSVIGRQGQELGELRKLKNTQAAPAEPSADDIPDVPLRDAFETDAEYQKAMKGWYKGANSVTTREAQTAATIADFDRQRIAAGISDEDWKSVEDTILDPQNQTPARLKLVADFLKDPDKVIREASTRIQNLVSRNGVPGSSGATGGGSGERAVTKAEVESFNAVMRLPIGMRAKAAENHKARFGRFVKNPQ